MHEPKSNSVRLPFCLCEAVRLIGGVGSFVLATAYVVLDRAGFLRWQAPPIESGSDDNPDGVEAYLSLSYVLPQCSTSLDNVVDFLVADQRIDALEVT